MLKTANEDRKIITTMISSCEFAIHVMETGYWPAPRRTIDRREKAAREFSIAEIDHIRKYDHHKPVVPENKLTPEQLAKIDQTLSILSKRERETFVLIYGQNFTMSQAAELLNVSKSTINTNIIRSKKKIKQQGMTIHN